jgi:hypothetical protein
LFIPPRFATRYFFGTKNPLLQAILDDTDLRFAQWSVHQLTRWQNTTVPAPLVRITGSKDRMLPTAKVPNSNVIANGGHFMVVDNAQKVSQKMNESINKLMQGEL